MESTIAAPPRRSLTIAEFADEARARFGPDIADWAFECPGCGTVSAARDFPAECADRLALAAVECIGRHVQGRGCRRIAYSLDPGPWMVTLESGAVVASFALADAASGPLGSAREIGDTGGPACAETPSAPPEAPARALSVERGPARTRCSDPRPDGRGEIDLTDWDYRVSLGENASVLGFRAIGSPRFYFAYGVGDTTGSVNLPGGFNEALRTIDRRRLSIGIQDLSYAMELAISAAAEDDHADCLAAQAPEPEPELRPYWTAEIGWTDAHGIGCTCGANGRSGLCARCESLQECARCEHQAFVPECDMAAHLAEVHGETDAAAESEA